MLLIQNHIAQLTLIGVLLVLLVVCIIMARQEPRCNTKRRKVDAEPLAAGTMYSLDSSEQLQVHMRAADVDEWGQYEHRLVWGNRAAQGPLELRRRKDAKPGDLAEWRYLGGPWYPEPVDAAVAWMFDERAAK